MEYPKKLGLATAIIVGAFVLTHSGFWFNRQDVEHDLDEDIEAIVNIDPMRLKQEEYEEERCAVLNALHGAFVRAAKGKSLPNFVEKCEVGGVNVSVLAPRPED